MKLHHATAARAKKAGIEIEAAPEGSDFQYRAYWEKGRATKVEEEVSIEFFWSDAPELLDAIVFARMMVLEHPGFQFEQTSEGSIEVSFGSRELGVVEALGDLSSTVQDLFDALTDEERAEATDAPEGEDEAEEDKGPSTVVPEKYKRQYAEAGHEGNCGDWLAATLIRLTTGADGKLSPDLVDEIARLNGLKTDKYNRTTPGWQGRLRMTVRNSLVKVVCKQGFLQVPATESGDSIQAPAEWVAAKLPKPKAPKGKQVEAGE